MERERKANRAAWWSAAVLATMLMGGAGSLAGQCRLSGAAAGTSLELLPLRDWGFGTILEKGHAWGPWGCGSFVTRRRRLGFFAVCVLTRGR